MAGFLLACAPFARAQNTIGLIEYATDVQDGYVLVYPDQQGSLYLLDVCGQVVHTWPDSTSVPGNGARLIADGSILRTYVDVDGGNPFFTAGGNGEHIQIKDWENEVLWDYTVSSTTECMHHDAEILPSGNVLIIAWELKTIAEAREAGRDTAGFGYATLWPEKIMEVQPDGPDSGIIVWEWHVWDHLVQDFDPLALNYGVVADHPELVDINKVNQSNNNPDWLHINSIDYNEALDQIMLSVPFLNEIWVIDHSTTTAEAASHSGGNSGKGGDLLYRWGNPAIYDQGTPADQQLFFNHAANWIGPGLQENHPDAGKIMVFNNRVEPDRSSIDVLTPPIDGSGAYAYTAGTAFGPAARDKRYAHLGPPTMFSAGQGSGQMLPNGHVLAAAGRQGWLLQIRPDSTLSWSYILPMENGIPVPQGTEIPDRTIMFQAEWISGADQRLQGRVLDPLGYIELNPDTTFCNLPMSARPVERGPASLVATQSEGWLIVEGLLGSGTLTIHDAMGKLVTAHRFYGERITLPVHQLAKGQYLLSESGSAMRMRFFVQGY